MKASRMKFAMAVVAGALAVALAGCGSSSTSGGSTQETAATEETQAESAEQPQEAEAASAEAAPAEAAPASDYGVTIEGVRLGKDYEGKDCAIVTYSFTNNSDKTTSFAFAVYPKVFQNGIECDSQFFVEGKENDNYSTDIRPGTTVLVDLAYELQDLSEIEVEVTELMSFDNAILAEGTFALS